MDNQNYNNRIKQEVNESMNLRDELDKYLIHWKWFLVSVVLTLVFATVYLRYATPQYKITSKILIKEDESSFASELSAFDDLGMFGGQQNSVDSEVQILKSRSLATGVITELDLNYTYYEKGHVKESEVYGIQNPIKIKNVQGDVIESEIDTTFYVNILSKTNFELYDKEHKKVGNTFQFGNSFKIKNCQFMVIPNFNKKHKFGQREIRVQISPILEVVDGLVQSITIEPIDKMSSVIELSMNHANKEKGIDILTQIVENYNTDAIEDKSQIGKNTSKFISQRLEIIKSELEIVDRDAESYKKTNDLTNIEEESKEFFKTVSESEKSLFDTETQLKLIEFMIDEIKNQKGNFELIPGNLGFQDQSIATLAQNYNEILLDRNKILRGSSLRNPLVQNMDAQLLTLKQNLNQSLKNLQKSFQITLRELNNQERLINTKISSIPRKEREYKNIQRQQGIKEALYLYLLQKQEETEISLAVTTSNSKIIDNSYASNLPISPKRNIVFLACFLLGIVVPFGIIYFIDLFDTKLHSRKDLEKNVSVPILGDIPLHDGKEVIVVKEGSRSSAAEAFRLLRTNLDFLLTGVDHNCKSIFLTSTASGEGKSFVSVNLACTLALSGKKVALVGMDLRAPKITEYLGLPNRTGISNYIKDTDLTIEDIKFSLKMFKNLDVYSSGIIPPNPAELLLTARVEELFTNLKENYDYLIVDTAPVNMVTDTLLITKYADMFIYVARAGYLDKRLLQIPQNLYTDKRLPNMAMLINASDYKKSYGYGAYGAYGYGEVDINPWWKTFFKKG